MIPVERTRRLPGVDDAFIKLGRMLDGGNAAALASVIHSTATIVRDREEQLGQIFTELRNLSGVMAVRAPDLADAITSLDTAFKSLAAGEDVITRVIGSSADAVSILAEEQGNLERLVGSLDRATQVLARYSKATVADSDAALKDLRTVLDHVMTDDRRPRAGADGARVVHRPVAEGDPRRLHPARHRHDAGRGSAVGGERREQRRRTPGDHAIAEARRAALEARPMRRGK